MVRYLKAERPRRAVLLTECSMSDNVAAELPDVELVRPCNLCPHMKTITLEKVERSLVEMRHRIEIPAAVASRARLAVQRMLEVR